MKDLLDLAETLDETAKVMSIHHEVDDFAIDYLFALRRVYPVMKSGGMKNEKDMKMANEFVFELTDKLYHLFFRMLEIVNPLAAQLIAEEIGGVTKKYNIGKTGKDSGKTSPEGSEPLGQFGAEENEDFDRMLETFSPADRKAGPKGRRRGAKKDSGKWEEEKIETDSKDEKPSPGLFTQLMDNFKAGYDDAKKGRKTGGKNKKDDPPEEDDGKKST